MAWSPQNLLWGNAASPSKGSRKRNFNPRVVEAIPKERHLAHHFTRGLDLREEFRNVYRGEEARIQAMLKPPPEPEPRSIFVVPKLMEEPRRARSAASIPEKKAAPAAEDSPPRRRPGMQRPFVAPQDPLGLPNPHIERRDAIDAEISEQEDRLARTRSESALKLKHGFAVQAPTFNWDHQQPGIFLTENQISFFPRSVEKVKEFGCGKDSRYTRPYDETYLHREALARNKQMARF
uniref:Uncharacterized protein n=1 Tax=Alexandrium monilatum TaxID=311494 RepID=A0A7S4RJB2_9DINO